VCVDSVEGARVAEESGADRIELCSALAEGGLTPSGGLLQTVLATTSIDTRVLIRPRGGDFVYDDSEVQVMLRDIAFAGEAGAGGVVIGALTADGDVDRIVVERLVTAAGGMPVTFHRAFDLARRPHEALEAIVELGAERLLTSGQAPSALEGAELIAELVGAAGDRLIVMPGGGINGRTVARVLELTGAHEVHASAGATVDGPVRFRNSRVSLGGTPREDEFSRRVTDRAALAELLGALRPRTEPST
jgi:copper homeostasis protein